MTNDSADFVPSPGTPFSADGAKQWSESYMPLFEGRMVQQFDFAAKEYIGGQGRRSLWRCLYFGDKRISPHYFVRRTAASSELPVRAGFCDITGHANERTVLAALIPNDCVCGNKVPTCVFDREDPRLHLLWIAIANSFVIDWIVRRRISTTLNFFHWQQVPFPRIDPGTNVGYRLIVDAAALSHIGPGSAEMNTWLSTIAGNSRVLSVRDRATIRARIDAEVALLFGISFEDYALILSDFPSMDRSQPTPWTVAAGTRSRSTITRDKALLEYARLTGQQPIMSCDKAGPCDLVERVLLAEANGAVAYVPSQLASSIRERIQVGKDRSMSARAEIRVVDL